MITEAGRGLFRVSVGLRSAMLTPTSSLGRAANNDGNPLDIIWVIGGATRYAFVMSHRLNPSKPGLTVETTLTVLTDKSAGTYPIIS